MSIFHRNRLCIWTLVLLGAWPAFSAGAADPEIIQFSDAKAVGKRRPIIIAHRGGVVSPRSAECSLTAIHLAAEQGYDMVELDIQRSKDGVPVVFHDRNLQKACGKSGQVADFRANELEAIPYRIGNDRIVRLDTALKVCRHLGIGVMLDLKDGRDSPEFLQRIDHLLVHHQLHDASISFSGSDAARRYLKNVRFTATEEEMRRLQAGAKLDLRHRFWFGLPKHLQPGDVDKLKSAGALILPAINTFRYPSDRHRELAKHDIERLRQEGVDGFQIDSVYWSLIKQKP